MLENSLLQDFQLFYQIYRAKVKISTLGYALGSVVQSIGRSCSNGLGQKRIVLSEKYDL